MELHSKKGKKRTKKSAITFIIVVKTDHFKNDSNN